MPGNNLTNEDLEEYGGFKVPKIDPSIKKDTDDYSTKLKPEPRIKKTNFLDTVVKKLRNSKTDSETKLILADLVMSSMMDSYIRNECVHYCDKYAPCSNIGDIQC